MHAFSRPAGANYPLVSAYLFLDATTRSLPPHTYQARRYCHTDRSTWKFDPMPRATNWSQMCWRGCG